jgi:hypothetical protein
MQHAIASLIAVSARFCKIAALIRTRKSFSGKTLVFWRPSGFWRINAVSAQILIALDT